MIPHFDLRTQVEVPIDRQQLLDLSAAAKIKRPMWDVQVPASTLDLTWGEIIRAAILVGARDWPERRKHGELGGLEIWRRALLILSHLSLEYFEDGVGVVRTPVFRDADPTEKGAASYSIAMAMTLALARRTKTAHALLHYDLQHGQIGKRRPDLVSATCPDDMFFEAKGRFGRIDQAAMDNAVAQLREHVLSTHTTFASATGVGFHRGRLECYLQWVERKSSSTKFASTYFSQGRTGGPRPDEPIALALLYAAATARRELRMVTRDGIQYSVVRNRDLGLMVGLRLGRVQELVNTLKLEWTLDQRPWVDLQEAELHEVAESIEIDGVLLGWDGSRDVQRLTDDLWPF